MISFDGSAINYTLFVIQCLLVILNPGFLLHVLQTKENRVHNKY